MKVFVALLVVCFAAFLFGPVGILVCAIAALAWFFVSGERKPPRPVPFQTAHLDPLPKDIRARRTAKTVHLPLKAYPVPLLAAPGDSLTSNGRDQTEFVSFLDPVAAAFTVDVPQGWQVTGGFERPNLGDRRLFVEAHSPDGITVMVGDPRCPQIFCDSPRQPEGKIITSQVGCSFINLPASPESLAAYYLTNIATQSWTSIRITATTDRPDLAIRNLERLHLAVTSLPAFKIAVQEAQFETADMFGCCYAACSCENSAQPDVINMWEGSIAVCLAPPALLTRAIQVLNHMQNSLRPTASLTQLIHQDALKIVSYGLSTHLHHQQASAVSAY